MFKLLKRMLGITQEKTKKSAGVSFMVTQDMKRQLLDLGWPKHRVKIMSPALAHAILEGGKTYKG